MTNTAKPTPPKSPEEFIYEAGCWLVANGWKFLVEQDAGVSIIREYALDGCTYGFRPNIVVLPGTPVIQIYTPKIAYEPFSFKEKNQ